MQAAANGSNGSSKCSWCCLPLGCLCCVCSCLTCFLLALIAMSDVVMLVAAIVAVHRYQNFWTILEDRVVAVPILFIVIAVTRLLISLLGRRGKRDKNPEIAMEAVDSDDNKDVAEKTYSEKRGKKTVLQKTISFISWSLFIAQIVGGVMALENRTRTDQVTYALKHKFNETRESNSLPAELVIAKLQMSEECCGIYNSEDYKFYSWPIELKQFNCCGNPPCFQKEFKDGCLNTVLHQVIYLNTVLAVLGILIPVLAALIPITLLLVLFLCGTACLVCAGDSNDEYEAWAKNSALVFEDLFGIKIKTKSDKNNANEPAERQSLHLDQQQNNTKL